MEEDKVEIKTLQETLAVKKEKFSLVRVSKIILSIILLGSVVAGVYFFVTWRPVKIAWAKIVQNKDEHYMSCPELPFLEQVKKTMLVHADVTEKIKQAGATSVTAQEIRCLSSVGNIYFIKGDMEIVYSTSKQRIDIEKIIGDNFFGIPYRGHAQ